MDAKLSHKFADAGKVYLFCRDKRITDEKQKCCFAQCLRRVVVLVSERKLDSQIVFVCDECGLGYLDRETAQKCEEWCKRTGTCSIEITKKAVYFPDPLKKKE